MNAVSSSEKPDMDSAEAKRWIQVHSQSSQTIWHYKAKLKNAICAYAWHNEGALPEAKALLHHLSGKCDGESMSSLHYRFEAMFAQQAAYAESSIQAAAISGVVPEDRPPKVVARGERPGIL